MFYYHFQIFWKIFCKINLKSFKNLVNLNLWIQILEIIIKVCLSNFHESNYLNRYEFRLVLLLNKLYFKPVSHLKGFFFWRNNIYSEMFNFLILMSLKNIPFFGPLWWTILPTINYISLEGRAKRKERSSGAPESIADRSAVT